MYVVYALLYCVSQLEMLFAHELNIWPNQLGATLGRGTPHLQDIMNSVETWKTVWRNTTSTWHHELCWDLKDWSEETPPGEIILVSLAFKVPSKKWVVLPGSKSNNFFIFKYYPRGQPVLHYVLTIFSRFWVCYFLPNWSIPFSLNILFWNHTSYHSQKAMDLLDRSVLFCELYDVLTEILMSR